MIVKFMKLREDVQLPQYETTGSAGMDIRSSQDTIIYERSHGVVETGLAVEIPRGYEIQVRPRSGLAAKSGIFVVNAPGTIDSDYRGEIKVILGNHSDSSFQINKGDRIAQLVVSPVTQAQIIQASELTPTKRAEGGFGSTGTR